MMDSPQWAELRAACLDLHRAKKVRLVCLLLLDMEMGDLDVEDIIRRLDERYTRPRSL